MYLCLFLNLLLICWLFWKLWNFGCLGWMNLTLYNLHLLRVLVINTLRRLRLVTCRFLFINIGWMIAWTDLWWLCNISITPNFKLLSILWFVILLVCLIDILSLLMILLVLLILLLKQLLLLSSIVSVINLLRLSTTAIYFLADVALIILLCDFIPRFIALILWNLMALRL